MRQVCVPEKIYRGVKEYADLVGSHLDPRKDPKQLVLLKTAGAYFEMVLGNPETVSGHPETLALALFGKAKFKDSTPVENWLENPPKKWIAIRAFLKTKPEAEELVKKFLTSVENRALLCQAIMIKFYYGLKKKIDVVPATGEIASSDLFDSENNCEEGDDQNEE